MELSKNFIVTNLGIAVSSLTQSKGTTSRPITSGVVNCFQPLVIKRVLICSFTHSKFASQATFSGSIVETGNNWIDSGKTALCLGTAESGPSDTGPTVDIPLSSPKPVLGKTDFLHLGEMADPFEL